MKINGETERERERTDLKKKVKWKKKLRTRTRAVNIRVYSPANQIQPFHEDLNLGHECCILPICLPPL